MENSFFAEGRCVSCKDGMECAGGGTPPIQEAGHYLVFVDGAPLVYTCLSDDACPSGTNNTCLIGASGIACGDCDAGYFWSGRKCTACSGFDGYVIIFGALGLAASLCVFVLMRPLLRRLVRSRPNGSGTTFAFWLLTTSFSYVTMLSAFSTLPVQWRGSAGSLVHVL